MNQGIQEAASLYPRANVGGLHVALYARVSTAATREKPQDPETQLRRLRQYAEAEGYFVVREYADRASGADPSRPKLDEMLKAAREHRFSLLLVSKIDRLARSMVNLHTLLLDLEASGVKIYCVDQPEVSTKGPYGRLMLNLLGAFSEFERELIRDRTLAGLEGARARGSRLGRPRVKVSANRILDLLSEGKKPEEIAQQLKISVGTVYNRSKKGLPDLPKETVAGKPSQKTTD